MSAIPKSEPEEDTAYRAAAKALEDASGDQGRAISILSDRVRRDTALKQAILDPLIEYACGNAIRKAIQDGRSKVWNAPTKAANDRQRLAVLAASNLMIFPLPGGKLLKDATKAELIDASGFYAKQSKDMAAKSRWLALVADEVSEKGVVGQSMSEAKLIELQTAARGEAGDEE